MPRPRWSDLSERQQFVVLTAASVQLSLAATAWADLALREPEEINGSKRLWALVIAVNFIGPACWFRWGVVEPGEPGRSTWPTGASVRRPRCGSAGL